MSEVIIPAQPGFFLIEHSDEGLIAGGDDENCRVVVFREPIIAWKVTEDSVAAITPSGLSKDSNAILYPDGSVYEWESAWFVDFATYVAAATRNAMKRTKR